MKIVYNHLLLKKSQVYSSIKSEQYSFNCMHSRNKLFCEYKKIENKEILATLNFKTFKRR